jgi:outer membrane protein TolC
MKRLGFRLARWGIAGLPCLGLACAQVPNSDLRSPPAPAAYPASPGPAADASFNVRLSPEPVAHDANHREALTVSLDAVLRLAEEKNPQIEVQRAKVASAFAEKELAEKNWIPDIYVGVGYWRHEGGIQLQQGPLINSSTGAFETGPQINATYNPRDRAYRQLIAARQVWQSHGELTKITSEQLLEAATTYVDVLAAHSALSVSRDYEKHLKELQARVKKAIAAFDKPPADLEIELAQIEGELKTQQFIQEKLHAGLESLSAKLAYSLGLDPTTQVLPAETQIAAFHIVDANVPADALVSQALSNGPGIHELQGILWVIQDGVAKASGPARFLPEFNFQAGEGLFGAGQGGTMDFANRFDMGVQVRWNLSNVFTAEHKRQVANSQVVQAQWTYQELRQKLTLGVQESRNTIVTSGGLFTRSEQQIQQAKKVVTLTQKRLDLMTEGATYSQVMRSHQAVAQAQLGYIELLREFDKAELRLLILLGPGEPACRMELPCSQP